MSLLGSANDQRTVFFICINTDASNKQWNLISLRF